MRSINHVKSIIAGKIVFLLLLAVTNVSGYAQTLSEAKASHHQIKSFIATKYPEAKGVWILDEPWGYRVTFKTGKEKFTSLFSIKSEWIKTEKNLKPAELPGNIAQGVKAGPHSKAKILTAKEVLLPGQESPSYILELLTCQYDDYDLVSTVDKLYFAASGQLTKSEREPDHTLHPLPWDAY